MFGTPRCCRSEAFRGHTISGRESRHFNGLRHHFRLARPAVTHDGDRDAPVREIDGRLHPTELRRARGAPRPNRSAATGGSVASSGALRNGFDGTGQQASPSRLRGNKYRTLCPPWQEICRSEIVAAPVRGLALPSPAEPVEASGEGSGMRAQAGEVCRGGVNRPGQRRWRRARETVSALAYAIVHCPQDALLVLRKIPRGRRD